MGMGMSVSPQIWQQFIDLVFQDDLNKHKQNFDVIIDDIFYSFNSRRTYGSSFRSFQGATKIWFENITTQMPILQEKDSLHGIRISG